MSVGSAGGQGPQWIYEAENPATDPNTYAVKWWVLEDDRMYWCNHTDYYYSMQDYEDTLPGYQWYYDCAAPEVMIDSYDMESQCENPAAVACVNRIYLLSPERGGLYMWTADIWLNENVYAFTAEGARYVIAHELGHVHGLDDRYVAGADDPCNPDEETVMDAARGQSFPDAVWITGGCDDIGGPTALDASRIEDFYAVNAAGNPRVEDQEREWVIWAWDDSAWAENEYRLDYLRWAGTDWVQVDEENYREDVWQEPGGLHAVGFIPSIIDPPQPDGYYMLCMCTYSCMHGCQNPTCTPYVWLTLSPLPPPSVSLSGSDGNGSVSWGHVSGATYYEVFVDRWNNGNTVTLLNWVYDTASPRSFSYSVSDHYHAAVRACNASGCSSQTHSNPFWVWLQVSAPPSPPSVSISGSNGNGSVSWGHVSGATYYEVFVDRWNNGNTVTLLNWVYDTASPRSFSYSVSDHYHAAVRACNASGCSSQTHSNPFWVWLSAPSPTPAAPTNVTITQNYGGYPYQVRLCWTDNSNNEAKFQVRQWGYWTPYVYVRDLAANTTCFTSSYWSDAWHFCVRSVGSGGQSLGWVSVTKPTSSNVYWVNIPCYSTVCPNNGNTSNTPHSH